MQTDVRGIRFGAPSDLRSPKSTSPSHRPHTVAGGTEQYAGSCWNLEAGPRIIGCVAETIEALERRIDELRVAVREAVLSRDPALASARRGEVRRAGEAWEAALAALRPPAPDLAGPELAGPEPSEPAGSLLPLR